MDKIKRELEFLPSSLLERMKFFESYLYWFGWARRKDLMDSFEISSERAYRAIRTYKDICGEDGFKYDYRKKRYVITDGFVPKVINSDISNFVSFLEKKNAPVKIYDISQFFFSNVSPGTIRSVCFSITSEKPLVCEYLSLDSGKSRRTFLPHSLFYDGLKTYTRAFCFKTEKYRDFCLSRITRVVKFDVPAGNLPPDEEWNQIQVVEIAPANSLTEVQKEAIKKDFCMKDGVGRIEMKKPLVYYFIKRYNLDIPYDDPVRQQIVLTDLR